MLAGGKVNVPVGLLTLLAAVAICCVSECSFASHTGVSIYVPDYLASGATKELNFVGPAHPAVLAACIGRRLLVRRVTNASVSLSTCWPHGLTTVMDIPQTTVKELIVCIVLGLAHLLGLLGFLAVLAAQDPGRAVVLVLIKGSHELELLKHVVEVRSKVTH